MRQIAFFFRIFIVDIAPTGLSNIENHIGSGELGNDGYSIGSLDLNERYIPS